MLLYTISLVPSSQHRCCEHLSALIQMPFLSGYGIWMLVVGLPDCLANWNLGQQKQIPSLAAVCTQLSQSLTPPVSYFHTSSSTFTKVGVWMQGQIVKKNNSSMLLLLLCVNDFSCIFRMVRWKAIPSGHWFTTACAAGIWLQPCMWWNGHSTSWESLKPGFRSTWTAKREGKWEPGKICEGEKLL